MSDVWDDSRAWVPMPVAVRWLTDAAHVRKLVMAGVLELGIDPAAGLYVNRNSLERSIVALKGADAVARLDVWEAPMASDGCSLSEAATRAGVSRKGPG
jgi:hypothetical protein